MSVKKQVNLKRLHDHTGREAEQTRQRKRERQRTRFIQNPYQFLEDILDKERSGTVESSMEDIEQHLRNVNSDPSREVPLGDCSRLESEDLPETHLDTKEPSLSEVQHLVKKARTGSAPGPNGIPFRVYKMCPGVLQKLWSLLKVIWRKGKIPDCWKRAERIFTPKEKDSKDIGQFRTISLLNVEGKIFFEVLAKRLTMFLTDNNYVDTSIQKGGVPGFSGGIKLQFAVGDQTTAWQSLEKGIVTGCTISVVLFVMGMNLIINAAKRETRGPKAATGIYLPPVKGFMDNRTLTGKTHIQARWEEHQAHQEPAPDQLTEGLKQIDRSGLPDEFKAWLFQNGLLPRLMWPLMLYEEYKVAKARLVMTLKDSRDDMVGRADVETKTGKSGLLARLGNTRSGSAESKKADSRTRREMIQAEVCLAEEEDRGTRAVAMGCQGAWTKWQTKGKKMTWANIWRSEPLRIIFQLRSAYYLLPSPANLHRWGKFDDPTCPLCGKIVMLEHTLSSCQTALTQGKYRWRHNKVLQ
ncbi:uncharacterized protein LOC127846096 [Dreissena polymorpha]|uniref:uncharacterized protein LOC127846096 n=1 Tax=Dreissena polymorpha TaxID=45954 RepID=UPI0022656B0B|nr:uncharacterized protein LOC127846096 [Dreissena polymorpha]